MSMSAILPTNGVLVVNPSGAGVTSPNLAAGTVVDTGNVTGSATAMAFVVNIAADAHNGDNSTTTLTWDSDNAAVLTARCVFAGTSAGDRVAVLTITLGGVSGGTTFDLVIDGNGNVTFKQNGAFVVGHAWTPPRSTTWVRLRLDGVRVTVWDSSSGTFASPFYDNLSHSEFVTNAAGAYTTIATLTLTGNQSTADATGATTITVDNVTIRHLA